MAAAAESTRRGLTCGHGMRIVVVKLRAAVREGHTSEL